MTGPLCKKQLRNPGPWGGDAYSNVDIHNEEHKAGLFPWKELNFGFYVIYSKL